MNGLPTGWAFATLGEITCDCGQRIPQDDEKFQYVDIASVDRGSKTIASPQTFSGRDAPSRARKHVERNDVLVSMTRPNLNAVAMVPAELDGQIASTGFDVLRSIEVDPRWIFYTVRSAAFVDRMSELVQGALYPAVRGKDIRGYEIPLAPLAEQRRIADKLDRVLARVDACRDRLDRIPALLKRFRQSVLAAGISGRLTEDWRTDKEKGAVKGELASAPDWDAVPLGELIAEGPQNGLYKPAMAYGDGVGILRIDMFYDGEVTGWAAMKRLQILSTELSAYGLAVGDIVVNRVNSPPYVGKAALIRTLPEPCVFESNMMRIRLNRTRIVPEYCIRFLSSTQGLSQLRRNVKHAVNQASINQTDVKSVTVPLPGISEQHEIVRRVETLFAFADRLEARTAAARKQVEQLTPALLAKAFRGELVPQDPDDEPAAELLKRLAANRAEVPKARRRKAASSESP